MTNTVGIEREKFRFYALYPRVLDQYEAAG